MPGRVIALHDSFIGDISDGLCGSAEIWWQAHPSHWECERECHQGLTIGFGWEGNPEFGYVFDVYPNSIEAIQDVDLAEVHWTMPRVGIDNVLKQAQKGPSKVHSFFQCQLAGFIVYSIESIINDGAWTSVTLWDNSDGTDV